jgi:hypothetical protein
MVDLPIKIVIFHSYLSLQEGMSCSKTQKDAGKYFQDGSSMLFPHHFQFFDFSASFWGLGLHCSMDFGQPKIDALVSLVYHPRKISKYSYPNTML